MTTKSLTHAGDQGKFAPWPRRACCGLLHKSKAIYICCFVSIFQQGVVSSDLHTIVYSSVKLHSSYSYSDKQLN